MMNPDEKAKLVAIEVDKIRDSLHDGTLDTKGLVKLCAENAVEGMNAMGELVTAIKLLRTILPATVDGEGTVRYGTAYAIIQMIEVSTENMTTAQEKRFWELLSDRYKLRDYLQHEAAVRVGTAIKSMIKSATEV